MVSFSLRELAERFELEYSGDPEVRVTGVCSLLPGFPGRLGFLSNPKFRAQLAQTQASIVVLAARDAEVARTSALIARDPYLAYARIAGLFDPDRDFVPGIAATATVDASARLGAGCFVGAGAVIGRSVVIGDGVFIGPNCVVEREAVIGAGSKLVAQVFVGPAVQLGLRCQVQPGAVIGGRGFGNARGPQGWEEVPQLGTVRVGDDVEIGANTCIDRGAIEDTVIENGVRLDNLIQIAHNCRIGAHTAIAGCTGIAGSTRIGQRCMIGGAGVINGHIEIADDVVLLGMSMATHSIDRAGVYGSGLPVADAREWRKTVARIHRLDRLEQRLRKLETGGRHAQGESEPETGEPSNHD